MSLIKHMKLRIKLFKSIEIQVIKFDYKIWYIRNKERTFSIVINGSFNFLQNCQIKTEHENVFNICFRLEASRKRKS